MSDQQEQVHVEVTTPTTVQEAQEQETQEQTTKSPEASTEQTLPTEVEEQIKALREEAAKYRVERNESRNAAKAKDQQFEELRKSLMKAIGAEGEATPEELVEQANAKVQEADKRYEGLIARVALSESLAKSNADADMAAPFIRGLDAYQRLDASAEDYEAQVAAVVADALEKYPKLRAVSAPVSSGNTTTPTNNGEPVRYSREDLQKMTPEEINKAYNEGKLSHLLKES